MDFEVYEAGSGERLALCLHGFPEHAIAWEPQVRTLVALGYRVWAPNQRGYGRSSRPARVAEYRIARLLEDVSALVDASGAREVVLIGHDWGAVVAWFFAMRMPRPIARLVVINVPHPAVYLETLRRSWRQWSRSWYVLAFQVPGLAEWVLGRDGAAGVVRLFEESANDPRAFAPSELATYRTQAAVPGALRAMLAWYRAAARGGFEEQRALGFPQIAIPTCVIWGEDDVALGKETTYGTAAYVEDLRLYYLPGVSHWACAEAPERVNALLERFLGGALTEREHRSREQRVRAG
ncbi:MAG: alpha/beta hydrolase [Vulcanimicrobiaceae bacterium]